MNPGDVVKLVEGAAGALVVLLFDLWAFFTDRVISRRAHRERIADKDRQLADKDRQIAEWKLAHAAERTRADGAVLGLQTTNTVLAALHKEAGQ